MDTITTIEARAGWLRLLSWMSPTFPVGAFAYSHGLERAIAVRAAYVAACRDRGHLVDEEADAEVERRRETGSAEPVPEQLADDQPTRQLPLE